MSQPPQQPGPYGGQPPGYGQQPGPGQGPSGYPQHGGYPQQGSYPPPSGRPPQPGGYGGQGPYGPPPSYSQPVEPHDGGKPKSLLPWLLGGVGVLVIGGVVALILVLTNEADTSSPQGVAEAAVKAANSKDVNAMAELSCQKLKDDTNEIRENIDPASDPDVPEKFKQITISYTLGKVEQTSEDKATAEVNLAFQNVPEELKDAVPAQGTKGQLDLVKENEEWQVCGFSEAS